jgi:hypothetical protein
MGLVSKALEFVVQQQAREIIREALQEALDIMENMIGNEGQQVIYDSYVVPEFETNAQGDIENGWEEVDIGEYMEFMGEIVAEGNNIMYYAYDYAAAVLAAETDFSEE